MAESKQELATRPNNQGDNQQPARLIICGTPIGNLGDLTERQKQTFADADIVACEDTRQTGKLLKHLGLSARLMSYRESNERELANQLADEITAGKTVALVSDAGMPLISDPGYHLVTTCISRKIHVDIVPGISAAITALAVSGLPNDRFCFEGFLSRKSTVRKQRLQELSTEQRTMIFFEAPHRLIATLSEMAAIFGPDRPAAIARELTKLHEEILRAPIAELHRHFQEIAPRGEFTLVIAGASAPENPDSADLVDETTALINQGLSTKDAVRETAHKYGVSRHELYQAVLDQRKN